MVSSAVTLLYLLLVPVFAFRGSLNSTDPTASDHHAVPKQGWTAQPSGRGTFDILQSCAITLFLCSWSTLCLNLPAPGERHWSAVVRKARLTAYAFLGAEYIFLMAYGQRLSAIRSTRDFHESGYTDWEMKHAFFADAGGFVLQTAGPEAEAFPIDAKQLHYLVTHDHVKMPTTSKQDIKDRNKVDGLLRLFAVGQTLWFLVNTFCRVRQGLVVTTLELTTVAFVLCSLLTVSCWREKPADVISPVPVESDKTLAEILRCAGRTSDMFYSRTPLDFISQQEWQLSQMWSHFINILRVINVDVRPKHKPVKRLADTNYSVLAGRHLIMFYAVSSGYGVIFTLGWNFDFPTPLEQLLWRMSTLSISVGMLLAICGNEVIYRLMPRIQPWLQRCRRVPRTPVLDRHTETRYSPFDGRLKQVLRSVRSWLRNNTADQDPAMTMPAMGASGGVILAAVYTVARCYIFVADIIELRSLPPSAYQTVDWTNYIPHL